jgi:hypothetical protein
LQELNIQIHIDSIPDKGTDILLDFSTLKKGNK